MGKMARIARIEKIARVERIARIERMNERERESVCVCAENLRTERS